MGLEQFLTRKWPMVGGMLRERFGALLGRLGAANRLGFYNNPPGSWEPDQMSDAGQSYLDSYGDNAPAGFDQSVQTFGENTLNPDLGLQALTADRERRNTGQERLTSDVQPSVDQFEMLAKTPAVTQGEVDRIVQGFRENSIGANQAAMRNTTATGSARGLSPDAVAAMNTNLGADTMFQVEQNRAATEVSQENVNRAHALAGAEAWNRAITDLTARRQELDYNPDFEFLYNMLNSSEIANNAGVTDALGQLGGIEAAIGGGMRASGEQARSEANLEDAQSGGGMGLTGPLAGAGMAAGALLAAPTGGLSLLGGALIGGGVGLAAGGGADAIMGGGSGGGGGVAGGASSMASMLPYILAMQGGGGGIAIPSTGGYPSFMDQPNSLNDPLWGYNATAAR